jgi:integrase
MSASSKETSSATRCLDRSGALNTLRKIRRLHFRDGLSVRQISRRTGLSRNTIQDWLGINDTPTLVTTLTASKGMWNEVRLTRRELSQMSHKKHTLRDVFDTWKASEGVFRVRSTVLGKERALKEFEACFPGAVLDDITRAKAQDFKAHLHTLRCSSSTRQQLMNGVKVILNYAHDKLQLIPFNPWFGVGLAARRETTRYPWTNSELGVFFALPLFTEYKLPAAGGSGVDAAYWVPLLGLFTGARTGELCQLQMSDIVDVDEVCLIDINENGEFKRLKTRASTRRIPVHSELIKLGFLDYVKAMRDAGHASLWPAMRFARDSNSDHFSSWFRRFQRQAIPNMPLPDFHSFRHTVRSKMNKARISARVQDAITGHAPTGSFGSVVYTHPDIDELVEAIEAIRYDGLSLPKVYRINNLIKLKDWAAATFRSPPNSGTLRKWIHRGLVQPKPELVGKCYLVSPSAVCSRKWPS